MLTSYSSRCVCVVRDARYDRKRELRHCEAVQRPAHEQFVCDENDQQTGVCRSPYSSLSSEKGPISLGSFLSFVSVVIVVFVSVLKQEMDKKTRRNQALRKQVALWLCVALDLSSYVLPVGVALVYTL